MALLSSSACFRSLAALAHYVPSQSSPAAGGNAANHSFVLSCPRPVCSSSSSEIGCHHFIRDSSFSYKFGVSPARFQPSRASASATGSATEQSIHDFTVKDIDGNDVSLSKYKGKVLLVVNVASRCGLTTSNYNELAELYEKLKGQDFEILAFPCNQFGAQEPGTNEEIKVFACSRFKAEYPIFDKIDVNGGNAAPVYKFLKSAKGSGILNTLLGGNIKWNFEKFLVDKDGKVVQRYDPTTSPLEIENDIKKLLES